MHFDIAKGTITRYCGSMKDRAGGGLQNMLGVVDIAYNIVDDVITLVHAPNTMRATPTKQASNGEMEDCTYCLFVSIIDDSHGDEVLVQHLLLALLSMQGTMKNLKE